MGIRSLSGFTNRSSSLLGLNLRLEVPSNKFVRGFSGGGSFLKKSSKSSPLGICDSVLGVPEGLINFSVSGGFQGFFSSFSLIAFIPGVVSGILKVFQGDVPLSGIPLSIGCFGSFGVLCVDQLLTLTNFGVPISSSRSSFFGITVYCDINAANSPEVGALSNPLVCWINVSIKIAAPRSVNVGGYLYTNVVKSSFIISIIPPVSSLSSLRFANTCLNNATVLLV